MESGDQSKKNFVKMTKTIAINVTNTDTIDAIDAIKTKVQELEGIASSKQKLVFTGKLMHRASKSWFLPANSCIDLYVKDGITISIQSVKNPIFSLNVKTSDTVSKIKAMIRDKKVIFSDEEISLVFSLKRLHDYQTLASCGVHNNAVLHMAARRRRIMHITLKLFQGPFIKIEVERWFTISQLKCIIGLPQDGPLKLFFSEQELIRQHKIYDHAMLQVRSVM